MVTEEQKTLIKDLYVNKRMSVSKTAKACNMPYTSTYAVLDKMNCLRKLKVKSKSKDQIKFSFKEYIEELIRRCCTATGMDEDGFRSYIKTEEGELRFEKAMEIYTPAMYMTEFIPECKIKRPQKNLNQFGSKPTAATQKIEDLMMSENGATLDEMTKIRGAPYNHINTLKKKGVKIVCICGRYFIRTEEKDA